MNNKNTCSFIGWYGGDRAISQAAWTSTNIDIETKTDEQIGDLIVNKLQPKKGKFHLTPFERGIVHFVADMDIASHIHMIKHRHAGTNGESARYRELKEDRYYLPEDWGNIQVSKGGDWYEEDAGYDAVFATKEKWLKILEAHTQFSNQLYHSAIRDLTPVLGRKRAKETARYFKTYNSQINTDIIMNMSCFKNFYELRHEIGEDGNFIAQKEIALIAEQMLNHIKNIEGNPFKYTLKAFKF